MNSRVGFTTGAITLAMVLGLIVFWATNDSVRADSKEGDLATKSSAEKHQESREQPIDTEWQPGDSIRASKTERKILQELKSPATLEYAGVSLREALEDMARRRHIRITFKEAAIDEADLSIDHDIDLSGVASLYEEVTFAEALELMLRPAGLEYFVANDRIFFTSEEDLAKYLVTRAYSSSYIPDLAARTQLANHLQGLLMARQALRRVRAERAERHRRAWAKKHGEEAATDDSSDDGFGGHAGIGMGSMISPTIKVFKDRVVMIGSVADQKDLQELLRLIYLEL